MATSKVKSINDELNLLLQKEPGRRYISFRDGICVDFEDLQVANYIVQKSRAKSKYGWPVHYFPLYAGEGEGKNIEEEFVFTEECMAESRGDSLATIDQTFLVPKSNVDIVIREAPVNITLGDRVRKLSLLTKLGGIAEVSNSLTYEGENFRLAELADYIIRGNFNVSGKHNLPVRGIHNCRLFGNPAAEIRCGANVICLGEIHEGVKLILEKDCVIYDVDMRGAMVECLGNAVLISCKIDEGSNVIVRRGKYKLVRCLVHSKGVKVVK